MPQAIIISGFTCVGKSTLAQNPVEGYSVIDLDSSLFEHSPDKDKNANFKQEYGNAIRNFIDGNNIILVSTHSEIRDELQSRGMPFSLVLPQRQLKEEWLQRLENRGSKHLIPIFSQKWHEFISSCESQQGCDIVFLNEGEYLADIIPKIIRSHST